MNTNLIHNILNAVIAVVSALAAFDWGALGLSAPVAVKIVGAAAVLKLVINAVRDGIGGLIKEQPPVV